jgi:hypothetical protein
MSTGESRAAHVAHTDHRTEPRAVLSCADGASLSTGVHQ